MKNRIALSNRKTMFKTDVHQRTEILKQIKELKRPLHITTKTKNTLATILAVILWILILAYFAWMYSHEPAPIN